MGRHVSLFRGGIVLLFLLLFIAPMVSVAVAVDSEITRQTLKRLPGVYVIVEEMHPNIQKYAQKFRLTKDQLRADTEHGLKENGVRALSRDEWMKTRGNPVLYLSVNTHETERYWYAYDIKIELQQVVSMEANPNVQTLATTWSISMTGMTNVGKLQDVRVDVGVLVGRFVDAFRATNPQRFDESVKSPKPYQSSKSRSP